MDDDEWEQSCLSAVSLLSDGRGAELSLHMGCESCSRDIMRCHRQVAAAPLDETEELIFRSR